jgi:hypothetical protein
MRPVTDDVPIETEDAARHGAHGLEDPISEQKAPVEHRDGRLRFLDQAPVEMYPHDRPPDTSAPRGNGLLGWLPD